MTDRKFMKESRGFKIQSIGKTVFVTGNEAGCFKIIGQVSFLKLHVGYFSSVGVYVSRCP